MFSFGGRKCSIYFVRRHRYAERKTLLSLNFKSQCLFSFGYNCAEFLNKAIKTENLLNNEKIFFFLH